MLNSYDYIIVGAGSSGCVVAARLAQETKASVLLIEAGSRAEDNPDTMSADGFKYCFANDNVMLDRFSVKQQGLAGRSIYQGTGTTMGGSGSVNGMVYTRGDKADFDAWPVGWQWQDIAPTYDALEQVLKPQSRSATGFTLAAISSSLKTGFQHKDGLNDGQLAGFIGHNDMNYQGDKRSSSYMAYIHNKHLDGLTVLSDCLTHRVITEDKRAIAVEIEMDGKKQRINANQEIILTAGALETPKLLMLSGIGPAAELNKFAIPIVLAQESIGANLHDHPNVPLFFRGKKKIDFSYPQLYAFARVNPETRLQEAQADTCFAFFSAPITMKQSMYRMLPALALPRKLYPIKALRKLLRTLVDIVFTLPFVEKTVDQIYGIVVILGKPESRGSVRLQSTNVRDQALVDPAYYQSPNDMQTMIKGVRVVQNIASQAELKNWGNSALNAGGKAHRTTAIKHFIEKSTMTTFHFCGSCKMGDTLADPVDSRLRLKGITALRIADASVIPEIPVSAINAPSMMIAHRAVDFILQDKAANNSEANVDEKSVASSNA